MAIRQNELQGRKSREEYFAFLERAPEHRYEYLDGYIYTMTGGSPDHFIIGSILVEYSATCYYRTCPTIQEYLLVSSEAPIIELFRREKGGFRTLYTLGLDDSV